MAKGNEGKTEKVGITLGLAVIPRLGAASLLACRLNSVPETALADPVPAFRESDMEGI